MTDNENKISQVDPHNYVATITKLQEMVKHIPVDQKIALSCIETFIEIVVGQQEWINGMKEEMQKMNNHIKAKELGMKILSKELSDLKGEDSLVVGATESDLREELRNRDA